ncbi:glycerophosphodiester phosphodiesterase family protein [uncultured Cohaesibacter sp.]|uniref:glycerophosphodiester phosphodiesterase family protein n=1 Tax=uncultured Cohaesibacter sp. TaxID=1002546 RepID=UPI002AAB509F|nr:glycerophosphodiester phosphodiesterase family protein [uncultured Cohaesibacter sp.]
MPTTQSRLQGRVIDIHGHRGARGLFPENTLEGYAYALSTGIRTLELDIQLTADDILVATHDFTLSTAQTRDSEGQWLTGTGPESITLTAAELKSYDIGGLKAGSTYGAKFPDQAFLDGVTIPTLEEIMVFCRDYETSSGAGSITLNIEVKSDPTRPGHTDRAEKTVDILLALIEKHAYADKVIIQSFDWAILDFVQDKAPHFKRSYLTIAAHNGEHATIYKGSPWLGKTHCLSDDETIPALIKKAGGNNWSSLYKDLNEQAVSEARALGIGLYVWTVNETEDIDRMINLGVDAIISDYPSRVQRRLLAHQMHWLGD